MTSSRCSIVVAWLAALAVCVGSGCSSDKRTEQRRALLRPTDSKAKYEEYRRKMELYGPDGELLETDEQVAGIALPKGLSLDRKVENTWVLESSRIPHEKLVNYFSRRLMSTTVERGEGSVEFGDALLAHDLKAPRVSVQVDALAGAPTACRVVIRQSVPFVPAGTPEEVEAQLRARRAYAD